jgi:4-amino-4-deoxy-L-arabinose transferase-like glycosyltransferase
VSETLSRHTASHVTARPRLSSRLLRGASPDPAWYRPALLVLLLGTAVLYLADLSASGYGNSFYAAAVQAGSENWKAWFFGSLDSSSFITVDKPPASLWVMGLSARIFGFSSWSMLVPDALMGVASVGLLAATVRRLAQSATGPAASAAAGLIAGAVLALTPAAVLIFRFNNPDAFMVMLLAVAAYCLVRALEQANLRWLLGVGVAVGFGFLTKSGEALLPVPAFALAYLVAAPASVWRRIWHLLAAGVTLAISAGWWIVTVLLWPASSRPYIGGSTDNNPLELAFGYNGLSRLFGNSGGGPGGGGGAGTGSGLYRLGGGGGPGSGGAAGGSFGGAAGIQRLFGDEFGREISWLLPAAAILLLAGLWLTWRRPRTDLARAGLIVFGGWLLITGLTFAYMQGTIHPYYTVALAPSIGALAGIGGVLAWQRARQPRALPPRPGRFREVSPRTAALLLAVAVIVNGAWDLTLLRDNSSFHPSLAGITLAAVVLAIIALAALALWSRAGRRLLAATAALTGLALAIPSAAWAFGTAATPHTGSIPTAVSGTGSGNGFGGGGFPGGTQAAENALAGGGTRPGGTGTDYGRGTNACAETGTGTGSAPIGTGPGGAGQGGTGGAPPGGASGGTSPSASGGRQADCGSGTVPGGAGAPGGAGGAGASSALVKALRATTTRWAAAVQGSQSAASLELASGGKAVMAMGGFTGSDPAPTLAEFEAWVRAGDITYYIAGGGGAGPGGAGTGGGGFSQITSWAEAHYKSATIGGQTVYLLLSPK